MDYITITIFFIIGVVFYILGATSRDDIVGTLASGVFIILGISVLAFGMQVPTNSQEVHDINMTENTTQGHVDIIQEYETMSPILSRALGLIILWMGVYTFTKTSDLRKERKGLNR